MRLRKLAILMIALSIFLTACANTAQQEGQASSESAPFEITLKRVSEALGQPERIGVGARYGAYAGTSKEQFEELAKLLANFDLSSFESADAEEMNEKSGMNYADLLITQGDKSFTLQISGATDVENGCYVYVQNYIGFDTTAEEYTKRFGELNALPTEEKTLVLRGAYGGEGGLDALKEQWDMILLDKSDTENCAEITVLADTAEANNPSLVGQENFIMNKANSAVIKYYLDRGALWGPPEQPPEANFDLRIKLGDMTYLFDTSTDAFNINGEGLYVLDTSPGTFLRSIAP